MDGQPLDCYDYLSTYGTNNMSPFLKIFLAVLNTECLEKYFRHFIMLKSLEKYFRHFIMLKKRTDGFLCLTGECFHLQLNAKTKPVGEGAGWKSAGKMLKTCTTNVFLCPNKENVCV